MASARVNQQPSSGYIAVNQADSASSYPDQGYRHMHVSPSRNDADSVSSIHEGDNDRYELSTRHHPDADGDMAARGVSRVSHQSDKEPQIDIEERPTAVQRKREWRSWKLSWWFHAAVLLTEISFVIAIIVLDRVSARKGGLLTVPNIESSFSVLNVFVIPRIGQYYGLLWTSLPSLIFTLYSLAWATIVAASYERQPFIELQRGGSARRTIMLDYRAYPGFYSWVVAFMFNHIHLGCAMLLSLFVAIAVIPLSAHLFVASASTHQSRVPLSFATQYNDSIAIGSTNLQPYIDIATAAHAYGSTPPAWMTTEYAFAPFSTTATSSSGSSANLSATTDAYSAYLDCKALDSSAYTASYEDQGTDGGYDLGTVTVNFTDRACSGEQLLGVTSDTPTYARSWHQICKGQTTNRMGIFTGTYSSTSPIKLADFNVISCIPSYWHSTGNLTVSLSNASLSKSNFIAFTEHSSTAMQPEFANTLEYGLHFYTIFNAASAVVADALGFAVLSTARAAANNDINAAMAPDAIRNAMELVFTTIYAALATTNLLTPAPSVTSASGVLVEPANRLFVSPPIAYTIVAVLVLVAASHLTLWVYAVRHKSVLSEEPIGLLGNAVLLERSDVDALVRRIRVTCGENAEVRDAFKKRFDVVTTKCFWDEHEGRIRVDGLAA